MKSPRRLTCLALCVVASACAPKEKYQWGEYEPALYGYYKEPGDGDAFATKLGAVVARAEQDGRVPPGLYAEYGYALMLNGKNAEAVGYFEREKKLWPESKVIMDTMLKSLQARGTTVSQSNAE